MNKRCGEKMIVKRIISMAWEGISVAEYRRFISYMYLYEDGRKTINSGFVRVENRDDQCRILIHMSGIYNSENDVYRVYMLIRESGGYIGIAKMPDRFYCRLIGFNGVCYLPRRGAQRRGNRIIGNC